MTWTTETAPRNGQRRYLLDESFFDVIDTEDKAYWLGFVTADGSVKRSRRTYSLRVDLAGRDRLHLEKLRDALGSSAPVRTYEARGEVYFIAHSRHLVDALGALAVLPRKTFTVEPWTGLGDLQRHYWRGLFDGDGSLSRVSGRSDWSLALCGSRPVVEAFAEWARNVCGATARAAPFKSIYRWAVVGTAKPQLLATELYLGASIALDRKEALARELLAIDFASRRLEANARRASSMRDAWASGRHSRAGRG